MEDNEESPRNSSGSGAGAPKRGHRTACNSCKRMKVKCEWDQEAICNRCSKHQTECVFTIPERKKREKKETYLTSLEDRLNRMEAVMAQSGLSMPGKETDPPPSTNVGIGDIPDKLSMLKIFDDGTTLFIGAASGFSIFGEHGLKWVTQITGSNEFAKVIMSIPNPHKAFESMGPDMWHRLPDDLLEPPPSKERAMIYINEFFDGFGAVFPLFSRPIFMEHFARKYPVTASEDPAWYACVNVVFAIGSVILNKHLARGSPSSSASSPRSQNLEDEVWWKWLRNATSTYIDLQFREGSLPAVQAMIGMAFILQTLPNPYPCSVLAGAALRLAQAIGLHRSVTDVGLSKAQIEERRNVFWTGVTIERAIIIRSGRPSVMHEDDIGVDLPKQDVNPMMGPNVPRPFRYMATLALLQGRIYNKLYSAKATLRPPLERLQWVSSLDEELQEWKDSLPIEIRPGNELKVDKEFVMPVLMMHYGYFNTLSTIHRCSIHYKSWSNGGEPPLNTEAMNNMKLNPRVFASGAITVGAARSVVGLLKQTEEHIDINELNMLRMLDYYPLSACLILFANVLSNPRDSQALSDIELMKSAVNFLSSAMDAHDKSPTSIVLKTFRTVNELASQFVQKCQAESTQTSKRSREHSKKSNFIPDTSSFDNIDKVMTYTPPSADTEETFRTSTSSISIPLKTQTQTQTPTSHTSTSTSAFTPPPTTTTSNPPFQIQQTLPNQPSTTQQFLTDPLQPLYNNPLYPSTSTSTDTNDMTNDILGLDTNMDFFPSDLLMPADGSWFFPLGAGTGGEMLGTGGMGNFGGGSEMGGIGAGGIGSPMDEGMPRDTWMSTTGMGFGWSMGGGQNVDWGFGSGGGGSGTGTGSGDGGKENEGRGNEAGQG